MGPGISCIYYKWMWKHINKCELYNYEYYSGRSCSPLLHSIQISWEPVVLAILQKSIKTFHKVNA